MNKYHGIIYLLLVTGLITLFSGYASAEVLTLPEGMRLVAERSRQVRISMGDEKISEADALIEKSGFFPMVNASASGTMLAYQPGAIFGDVTVPISQKDFYSYSLKIRQTLYDFRENASRFGSSMMRLEARRLDTKRTRNLAAVEFAVIYFDLLESEKMLHVAEQEVERLEAHLKDARNLYGEGVITKNDLLQAEVRLSDSRQRLLNAKTARAINASRLNNSLARPLKTEVEVADVADIPETVLAVNLDLEKAWDAAERQRTEIRIVDAELRSLYLDEEAKKAEYYPKLFAEGSYDFVQNRYQTHEGNWGITLGLGINLFSGGKTRAEVAKVKYRREKLFEQRNKLVDEIKLEVERFILDTKTARDRVMVTKDAVRQAEENLRINRVRYTEGVGTATEVLDAVTLLTVAETNYYRAVYDSQKSEISVLYAVGKDLLEVYK